MVLSLCVWPQPSDWLNCRTADSLHWPIRPGAYKVSTSVIAHDLPFKLEGVLWTEWSYTFQVLSSVCTVRYNTIMQILKDRKWSLPQCPLWTLWYGDLWFWMIPFFGVGLTHLPHVVVLWKNKTLIILAWCVRLLAMPTTLELG